MLSDFHQEPLGIIVHAVVSFMRRPRNVFIRLSNAPDFLKALSRETCEVNRYHYRAFHWKPDFNEDEEPSLVPVWIILPRLPPNYYHESFSKDSYCSDRPIHSKG